MHTLSGLDSVFLHSETPTTPMNVIATITLDPRTPAANEAEDGSGVVDPPLDYEAIVERLAARLPRIPQFRRRLIEMPLGMGRPVWLELDAEEIDLEQHVMRVLAREPGGREELAAIVAKAASARLDRSRPLWTLWVVEGLEAGKLAIVIRAHHALLDGMSGAALLLHLFDADEEAAASGPQARATPLREAPARRAEPSPLRLLGHLMEELPQRVRRNVEAVREVASSARRVADHVRKEKTPERTPAAPLTAPRIHLNRSLSNRRTVAYARVPYAMTRKVRKAFGGTLNSVILAGCTEALRRGLQGRGELPEVPLVAAIPVSTRSLSDAPGGNRISAMLVRLPVQLEDPVERFLAIRADNQLAKRFHRQLGGQTLASLAELIPGTATALALDAYAKAGLADAHPPLANVTISTVTGPPTDLRLGGARVEALHPHGPLMEGSALNITVMRYGDSIDIGVLACAEALPEPRAIADATAAGIERLAKLARQADDYLAIG